jgi:hypothetical protein
MSMRYCLLSLLLLSLVSCKRNTTTYFTTGIAVSNYDNCQAFIIEDDNDTIGDTCYVIRINYASDQTAYYSVDDNNSYGIANRPVSIAVTSFQNFDATHPAGTLLNDYFIAGPGINSTINDVVTGFEFTQDYYPTHDPDDLWLMQRPQSPGNYQFIVRMDFDNGVILRDTTEAIRLHR